jgi:streptogramin lyase
MKTPRRRVRRGGSRYVAVAVLALTASAVSGLAAARASTDPPPGASLVATIPVDTPRGLAAGFGSIWVANGPHATVTRIDPATNAVEAVVPVPDFASVLAVGDGAIWVTSFPGNTLTRIDPSSNTATGTISLAPSGLGPIGVTFFGGYVWVANHDGEPTSSVAKVDPATLAVVDVIPVGNASSAGPQWVASGAGSIWTDVWNIGAVVRIDPVTDAVTATIPDKGPCGAVAASDTAVWVAGGSGPGCAPGVTRIDPATNRVTGSLNAGGPTGGLALDGGTLWYGTTWSDFLGRVDASASSVVGQLKLPGTAFALTAAFGYVWANDRDDGLLFKILPS